MPQNPDQNPEEALARLLRELREEEYGSYWAERCRKVHAATIAEINAMDKGGEIAWAALTLTILQTLEMSLHEHPDWITPQLIEVVVKHLDLNREIASRFPSGTVYTD